MNYRKTFNRITLIAWSTIAVIFFMCSITLNNAQAKFLFNTRIDYSAGDGPSSVAIGDLNGDGNLDLAVANEGSANVSVLLGNGDGSFQSTVNYGAGDEPVSVAIGDLNGDGDLDLAVANGWHGGAPGNVSVLLGNGDGSFQSAANYDAGEDPQSVAIGDLNGDGDLDLAVANQGFWILGNVLVLLGNGDGTFQSAVNYGAGDSPWFVAIGDLNGDGDLDLAVANRDGGDVSVLLGNGDGTFQSAVNYGASVVPRSVAIGDLNGDANHDLAVANLASDNVSILINKIQVVNDLVTFKPDPSTFEFIVDTAGCPSGFVGKFVFDAALSNICENVLGNLLVEVFELTNDNLLLTDIGLIEQGERFAVQKNDNYADGLLSPDEFVNVPFTVCLKEKKPFRLFVDVSGIP